jgi:hypothetical protein
MTEQHHITRLVVPNGNLFIKIPMSMIIFYKRLDSLEVVFPS